MEPDYDINRSFLQHWAKMPGWNIKEQAALLLELDPHRDIPMEKEKEFFLLKQTLKRAQRMRLLRSPTIPAHFVMWVDQNPQLIAVPTSLREEVEKHSLNPWKSMSSISLRSEKAKRDRRVSAWTKNKSYKTIMSAILVMAMEKYHYKPGVKGGPTSGRIAAAMAQRLIDAPKQQSIAKLLARASEAAQSSLIKDGQH